MTKINETKAVKTNQSVNKLHNKFKNHTPKEFADLVKHHTTQKNGLTSEEKQFTPFHNKPNNSFINKSYLEGYSKFLSENSGNKPKTPNEIKDSDQNGTNLALKEGVKELVKQYETIMWNIMYKEAYEKDGYFSGGSGEEIYRSLWLEQIMNDRTDYDDHPWVENLYQNYLDKGGKK